MAAIFNMLFATILLLLLNMGKDLPANGPEQQAGPLIIFGVIADTQYCECEPSGTRFYNESILKLRDAISELNRSNLSFIVNMGDLIDRDYSSFRPVLDILSTSDTRIYNLIGNHDLEVAQKNKGKVAELLGTGKGYYSFSRDGFRFIFLNSTDISTGSPSRKNRLLATELIQKLEAANSPTANDWNGTIGDKQKEWLIAQLDEASSTGERVIIFSHHPVWPQSVYNMFEYKDILDIIGKYNNIGLWLSGHNHEGSYGNYNLIHFVGIKGMVETRDLNSYAIVELYNNKIWIKGSGREKSQILAWKIIEDKVILEPGN